MIDTQSFFRSSENALVLQIFNRFIVDLADRSVGDLFHHDDLLGEIRRHQIRFNFFENPFFHRLRFRGVVAPTQDDGETEVMAFARIFDGVAIGIVDIVIIESDRFDVARAESLTIDLDGAS